MDLYCRIIQSSDIEEIFEYEMQILKDKFTDEGERMLEGWSSRWRKEAMEHYFSMGWSFLVRDKEKPSPASEEGLIIGYFMAQPLVFFEGQTQSLWVEHVQYSVLAARDALVDLAIRLGKEKHFQRVILPGQHSLRNSLTGFRVESWQPENVCIKTTR